MDNDIKLTEREIVLIANCVDYASGDPAGLPGHNLILLVDKLTSMLATADYGFLRLMQENHVFGPDDTYLVDIDESHD